LRLRENRRLNKEAHFSQRRKGGAIYFSMTIILAGRICRSVKNVKQIRRSDIPEIFIGE